MKCMGEWTRLIEAARTGTPGAVDDLVAATYAELRSMAHARLARSAPITVLDTTSLVHECYLRLLKIGQLHADNRKHFLAYAGRAMRSIIVDFARQRLAQRRGGHLRATQLSEDIADDSQGVDELLGIDDALRSLADLDPRLVQVVELRYFAGLTNQEIATALEVDERTVRRDWDKARALLYAKLNE
jgi:RNA polymerase sigma factor (TIGR02999 family)